MNGPRWPFEAFWLLNYNWREYLKDWIRMMGWMKFNELHFHLNDNSWGHYPGYSYPVLLITG